MDYNNFLHSPHAESTKISKFLNKKISNITKKFISSKEVKSRRDNISKNNVIKNKKLLQSKIKNKQELLMFKKILNNYKKFK